MYLEKGRVSMSRICKDILEDDISLKSFPNKVQRDSKIMKHAHFSSSTDFSHKWVFQCGLSSTNSISS